ncbi:MAG: chain length-determining protein [Alphaproteobacteria bacterium]|nr:chain length-determining protein [Alphaproteobacteria bacterium]
MDSLKDQLLHYVVGVWRRRWLALGVAWLVCVAGWIFVASIPNQYQSTARIYVDTGTLLAPLLRGISVDTNVNQQVEIMQRTLLSRPNLEAVMRATDLDVRAPTSERREQMLQSLERRAVIRAQGSRNLFSLEFTDRDPVLARRVVQSLLTIFIESNVGSQRREMERAVSFLDGQIAQYETQIRETEERLANFRQQYRHILPARMGGEQGSGGALDRARGALATATREYEEAQVRRNALARQLANEPRHFTEITRQNTFGARPQSELDIRLQAAQQNLDGMLLRYTDQHPDVVAARRTIEALKRQKAEQDANAPNAQTSIQERKPNPVYEQLQLKLSEAEINLELLKRRVAEQQENVNRIEAEAEKIPQVETEFADLNRDYGILRKNYETLLERRESARMSQEVEAKADKVQFRVVDPPTAPLTPTFPNRPLFFSAVLIAGLGAGVMLALVLTQFDDSFSSIRQLRQSFALPILGSVTRIVTARQHQRRVMAVVGFGAACFALTGVYGAILTGTLLDLSLPGLDSLIKAVRQVL